MTILGQNYRPRRRPMGPLILGGLVIALVAFLVFAYSRGGEVPLVQVEKQIPLPAAATGGTSPDISAEPEG